MEPFDLLVRNTSHVVTCDGPVGGSAEATLASISTGALAVRDGRVAWVGPESGLPHVAVTSDTVVIDARKSFVGPGLVEPHTHVIFGGDRVADFEQRCQGVSYLEIAQRGGGIASTVKATRAASERELLYGAVRRLAGLLAHGVTTCEVKSGYGLTVESELKQLRVARSLETVQPVRVISTLLALHAVPPEFAGQRDAYVRLCIDELLPAVAKDKLATFCDAFVEQSAFTADDARALMGRARELGLLPRLHVDQLTAGAGAQLAVELGAATADHLEQITSDGIAALAKSKVTAVLAPTSTLFARVKPYAPGRALRDAGVPVALTTNCNPGSSMSENVALAMGLACLENGLTPLEAYLGFTRFSADALGLTRFGRLAVGLPADFVIYQCADVRHLAWHLGVSEVRQVFRDGQPVFEFGRVKTRTEIDAPVRAE